MTDLKSLLKEARKLIDENKYKEAQDCCKSILRKDKENYLGLILLGKSFQDADEAPLAFQKAISCKKDNPLAWQGLANYYERKDNMEAKIKLLNVYEELLNFQMEDDKIIEILNKLSKTGINLKSSHAVTILTEYLLKKHNPTITNVAERELVNLLKSNVPYDTEKSESFLNVLNTIYENNPNDSFLELIIVKVINSKYTTILTAVHEIIKLPFFLSNKSIREWLCQNIFINYVQTTIESIENLETVIDILTKDITDYKYAGLLRSVILYEKGCYLESFKLCVSFINYNNPEKHDIKYTIKCCIKLKKWSMIQKLAVSFLLKFKDTDKELFNDLQRNLFISLAMQHKWSQAYTVAESHLNINTLTINEQALLAECFLEMEKPADDLLEKLINTEYSTPLEVLKLIKCGNYNEALSLLEENTSDKAVTYYYLGVIYWKLNIYDKCHINLLKAAKLDSDHPYTFLYLGNFYKLCCHDLEKAKKCFEKANKILPFDNNITIVLSEIYIKMGLYRSNFELLCTLTNSEMKNSSWVNYRLGLYYLKERNWEEAIAKFRNVLKSELNATTLVCLADAYFSRGSYTSALKAYKKALTLDPKKSSHCLTRIGYINTLLTQYTEAISNFEQVLIIEPESLLALKGISEAWMEVAKKKMLSRLYGAARDCAQNAVTNILKAINLEKQFISLFKILGDALMFVTKLPNMYSYIYIKHVNSEDTKESKKVEKLDIFSYAISCYSHVMTQKNDSSSFDLASAYLALYRETNKNSYCYISLNIILSCIKKKPHVWRNWNLIGKIFFHIRKYNLSQHCFIKTILFTRKMPIANIWCNLGTLYLKLKLYKLANYCYWRGQSALPSYPHSWIGQGLIAEVIREEEAMDLFRHATRLGYHRESILAYSEWVCRTLKSGNLNDLNVKYDIYGLHAIPYGTDLLQCLCCYEDNNTCAFTMLGILQERCGLLQAAKKSYEKSLINIEENNKNVALLNIGRIYLRLQEYDKAIAMYKAITEASLNSACGLALALYKKGLYEEAYSTYDTALHWLCEHENEKSDLLVAMAGIVYMFKGPDEAKILLFQSIHLSQKKPTAYSLFASCSLGILHSDENLSKLALRELQKYDKDSNFSSDIGFLKSYLFACSNEIEKAIKSVSDTIHDHPNSPRLWFYLAQYCLQVTKAKAASVSAQRALSYTHSQLDYDENAVKMFTTASIAEHISKNHHVGLVIAKKGLHMYPQESEIWAALVFSLLSNKDFIEDNRRRWLIAATGHMRRHLDISRHLSRWTSIIEKKLINYVKC